MSGLDEEVGLNLDGKGYVGIGFSGCTPETPWFLCQ